MNYTPVIARKKDRNFYAAAGGITQVGAVGAGILLKNLHPGLRGLVGVGGFALGGMITDIPRHRYKSRPVVAHTLAGAAGITAFAMMQKDPLHLRALATKLTTEGSEGALAELARSIVKLKKVSPIADSVLSVFGAALGVGLLTIPVVHSIFKNTMVATIQGKNKIASKVSYFSTRDSNAGEISYEDPPAPSVPGKPQATIRSTGTVRTMYNDNILSRQL